MTFSIDVQGVGMLQYDLDKNKVFLNNKETTRYAPTFIPNGDADPDFFGIIDEQTGMHYGINGQRNTIADESQIDF